jgi:drug/metabolite transporter (DMT)-like permease
LLAIAAALLCACSWGAADFLAGLQSRHIPASVVLLGSSLTGTVVMGVAILAAGRPAPPEADLLYAAASGILGLIALGCFYRALAIGTMSIVAPISSIGVAIPVVVGLAGGDQLTMIAALGFAFTISGVILASREAESVVEGGQDVTSRTAIFLSLIAAVCFGTLYVLIAEASRNEELWSVAVQKGIALVIIAAVVAMLWTRGPRPSISAGRWGAALAVGALDTAAVTSYAYASKHGALSVTSVVAAMFPVITLLLAHQVLGERISRPQKAGVGLALIGVAALAANSG